MCLAVVSPLGKFLRNHVCTAEAPNWSLTPERLAKCAGKLGGLLYIDLADDGPQFDNNLKRLIAEIRTMSGAKAPEVPPAGGEVYA